MAEEEKRIIDQITDSELSSGDFVMVDSSSEGTRKFDLGAGLTAINASIAAEATARSSADATINEAIAGLTSDLTEEAITRESAYTALQSSIAAEATAREAAINTEATARTNADTTLQGNITAEATARANAVAAEASARSEAVSAEATTRAEADTAINGEITQLKEDLSVAYITNNEKANFIKGSYIALNVNYGTVVNFEPVTHSSFAHIIIPCKKGDTFTITGTGASAPRLWGFTDTDQKLLSVEGSNISRTNLQKTATQDGYFVCNVTKAYAYDLDYNHLFNADNYEELKTKLASVEDGLEFAETSLANIYAIDVAFSQNGYINTDGTVSSHNDYRCTDYINVSANGTFIPIEYRLKVFSNTKIGLYDANKDVLAIISPSASSSLEEVTDTLNYVDGLVYARFCTAITNNYSGYYLKYTTIKNQLASSDYDNTFCNYDGNEISMFRKGLCIGDSLTRGTLNYYQDGGTGHYTSVDGINYPTYLGKLTGLNITNMGDAGYTAVDWWNIHQNDDLSGYDFAIIQLGVNDLGHYGGWTEPTETAFTNIINNLKTQNKKIKIFVANIIPAISYSSAGYLDMSESISSFVTNLEDEQVILLDMQAHGHTRDSEAYNCGHLSAYGYWRLAQDYKNYIGYYINTHKSQFREVQFIGSDYYYTPVS